MARADIDLGLPSMEPGDWLDTGKRVTRQALWADDPLTQVTTNVVLVAALMLSSSVGFVVGIPLALAALFLLGVGIARLAYRTVTE